MSVLNYCFETQRCFVEGVRTVLLANAEQDNTHN
jgi:hypothetical protein